MSASIHRRWQGRWIAGAGLVCLGAGGIFVSGCTTPSTADLNAPAKKSQQVAKTSGPSSGKKSSQKVAAKEASGKARISDSDNAAETRIVARKSPPKTDGSKRPASEARRQETQLASASSTARGPGQAAAGNRSDAGTIKQTGGNGQSPSIAKKSKKKTPEKSIEKTPEKSIESKRPEAQRPNPEPQAVAAGTSTASNHERRRADRLMERAHERYYSGYPEEALRLASVAFELEKSRQAVYRPGEERPSDYVTWLQSIAAPGSSNAPVIRPQQALDQQPTNTSETGSAVAAAGAETADRSRAGDVIGADAGSSDRPPTVTAADPGSATRSNTGADLAAPEGPRFTSGNQSNAQRAGANAGQVEVPLPPKPRSADAIVAMTNAGGSTLDSPATSEASQQVVNADRRQEKAAAPQAPQSIAVEKSAGAPVAAVAMTDDDQAEIDSFAESEAPGLIPARTTQLTIASLVGLVTGIAGMFGLSWWRHQERRHYAAGK